MREDPLFILWSTPLRMEMCQPLYTIIEDEHPLKVRDLLHQGQEPDSDRLGILARCSDITMTS